MEKKKFITKNSTTLDRISSVEADKEKPYKLDKSVFIGKQGNKRTNGLIFEFATMSDAIFTLEEDDLLIDNKHYLWSLHKLFMKFEDLTEYKFAKNVIGSWKLWLRFKENKELVKHIESWKEELKTKIESESIDQLRDASLEGSKGVTAAKWLAERGYDKQGSTKKPAVKKSSSNITPTGIDLSKELSNLKRVK